MFLYGFPVCTNCKRRGAIFKSMNFFPTVVYGLTATQYLSNSWLSVMALGTEKVFFQPYERFPLWNTRLNWVMTNVVLTAQISSKRKYKNFKVLHNTKNVFNAVVSDSKRNIYNSFDISLCLVSRVFCHFFIQL